MDLAKFLPKNQQRDTFEYFWSLIIEPGWVQAGIWRIEKDEAQVNFNGIPIAWSSEDDLVTSTDSALSAAVQNLPDNTPEPTKTVFGVVSSWVEAGQIKAEHLDKIKTICAELSLKPVGFVVISEAVAHYIKTEEGTPASAIIVGVYKENIELSVFNLGNLLGTTKIARSVSFADDISEGLSRFSGSIRLPSRFILYDGREGEMEEARQALLSVNWDDYENLKFLHTPKVEVVESKEKLKAICLAGASEMAQVEKVSSLDEVDKPVELEEVGSENNAEAFGFTVNTGASQEITQEVDKKETQETPIDESHQNVEPVEPSPVVAKKTMFRPGIIKKPDPKKFLNAASAVIEKFKFGKKSFDFGKTPLIAGFIFLVVLLVGGFAAWWFLPKATVTVYVSPKILNENFEAVIDPTGPSEFPNKISARLEKVTVDGELVINTTGVKTVGDKAKGQVTIYRAGTSMTLPSSTIIKGPDNLQFSIDESVNIASGSASSPSVTKVNVTASNIGATYNLSSGTSFSVGSYSVGDLEAKNENAFTGGSSREVNVVAQSDIENAEEELSGQLNDKAKSQLEEKIEEGEVLIDSSFVSKTEDKKFSAKVGDEASTIKLILSREIETYVVKKEDVSRAAKEYLKDKVPPGFILKEENIKTTFDLIEGGGDSKYRISAVANLLPDVDLDEIARKISGKYPSIAKSYMSKNVGGYTNSEIDFNLPLPGRLGTLPRVQKHIRMELAAQK